MNLIEEAVIIELFGIRMYAFGLSVMLGAIGSMITIGVLGKTFRLKQGTAPLAAFLSLVLGIICSRLVFCLLNQELGQMMPFSSWFEIAGGGWSMFGMIGGVFLAGWITAVIRKEKTARVLDVVSCATLPLIIAERIGENRIEDFDISRPLDNPFLAKSFLAVGEDEPCLATYYVAAAFALVLFVYLLFRMRRHREDGEQVIAFLLLFGAGTMITESLRYDRFLSVSFVGLQQIMAAVMLAIGVVVTVRKNRFQKRGLCIAALISLPLMVGIVIGLEFALDRTTWNKLLIYALMILTVSIPAALGFRLIRTGTKGKDLP